MNKPKFCIITPTEYLEQFGSQSEMHLILAHLVDVDEKYANFYKNRNEFKIMDNGAFELGESYDPEKLISLSSKCNAHAVVLPDYPFQRYEKTIEAGESKIAEFKSANLKTMFVPQSETGDVEGWIESYKYAANHPDIDIIGMSILGMPNAIPHVHISYARVVLTQILIERGIFNFKKYHHYLGLNSGPALEIPSLIKMGALTSCDSSGPVWAGLLGHEYTRNADSYQSVSKIKAHVDFDYPMVKDQVTLNRIQHNINLTQELFN